MTPDDERKARWERLGREGLKRSDCILSFHKVPPVQRPLLLQFYGMLKEQASCPHLEFKGLDQTPITDPRKRWQCVHCGKMRVGNG